MFWSLILSSSTKCSPSPTTYTQKQLCEYGYSNVEYKSFAMNAPVTSISPRSWYDWLLLFWGSKWSTKLSISRVFTLVTNHIYWYVSQAKQTWHDCSCPHGSTKTALITDTLLPFSAKSMVLCKTAVTTLLTHWSYCSLALNHWIIKLLLYH